MPKKTGTMKAWVTRNLKDNRFPGYYNFYLEKPVRKHHFHYGKWERYEEKMCMRVFEKHFFKLKPGAGPVPVNIAIKRRGK